MSFCPNCGFKNDDNARFCASCGTELNPQVNIQQQPDFYAEQNPEPQPSFEQNPVQQAPVAPNIATQPQTLPNKPKKNKAVIISIVAIILIAAVVLGVVFVGLPLIKRFTTGSSDDEINCTAFIKKGNLYFMNLDKKEPVRLTKDLFGDLSSDDEYYVNSNDYYYINKNGKKAIFADEFSKDSNNKPIFDLYWCDTSKKEPEPEKIDSSVRNFLSNEDGTIVIYIKNGNLYYYDFKEKSKIAKDIYRATMSTDGTVIGYTVKLKSNSSSDTDEENYDMYIKYADQEAVKLGNALKDVQFNNDMQTVNYIDSKGDLYQAQTKDINNAKKIDSNVYPIIKTYENGSFYYCKTNKKYSYYDFVDDDYKSGDSSITEPTAPNRPTWDDGETYEQYYSEVEAYNTKYQEYLEKYELYSEKSNRDSLRERLKENECLTIRTLCYYDGKKQTQITDKFNYIHGNCIISDEDTPYLVFIDTDAAKIKKVKLSDINLSATSDTDELTTSFIESINKNIISVFNYNAVNGAKILDSAELGSSPNRIYINTEDSVLYYCELNDADENSDYSSIATLYKCKFDNNKIQEREKIAKDVSTYECGFLANNEFFYISDTKNGYGDLYLNDELVDYDVKETINLNGDNTLFYQTDYDSEGNSGTLKMYSNGKVSDVAEDVYYMDYTKFKNDRYMVYTDYKSNNRTFTICVFEKGELTEIESGVRFISYNCGDYLNNIYS